MSHGHRPHPRRRGHDGGGGPGRRTGAWPSSGVTVLTSHAAAGYAEAVGRAERRAWRRGRPAGAIGGSGPGFKEWSARLTRWRWSGEDRCPRVRWWSSRDPPGRRRPRATRSESPLRARRRAGGRHPPGRRAPDAPGRRPGGGAARALRRRRSASVPDRSAARPGPSRLPAAGPAARPGGGAGPPGLVRPRCQGLVADSPRLLVQLPGADPSVALGPAQAAALLVGLHGPGRGGRDGRPGGPGGRDRAGAMSSCSGGTGWRAPRTSGQQSLLLGYRRDRRGGGWWSSGWSGSRGGAARSSPLASLPGPGILGS